MGECHLSLRLGHKRCHLSNLFIYHANLGDIYADDNKKKKALDHYQEAYRYKQDPKYLFFRARLSDEYYKDKQIAISLYSRYFKYEHYRTDWIDYAKKRILYLKEYNHQAKN